MVIYHIGNDYFLIDYPNSEKPRLSKRWHTTTATGTRTQTMFYLLTYFDIECYTATILSCNTNSKKSKPQLNSIGMLHPILAGLPCSRHLETVAECASFVHLHSSLNGQAMVLCTFYLLLIIWITLSLVLYRSYCMIIMILDQHRKLIIFDIDLNKVFIALGSMY
jgi:hypothetical protein